MRFDPGFEMGVGPNAGIRRPHCCEAWHRPHDGKPGQCLRAVAAMCARADELAATERQERQR